MIIFLMSGICFSQSFNDDTKLTVAQIAAKDSVNFFSQALNDLSALNDYKMPLDTLMQYLSSRIGAYITTVTDTTTLTAVHGIVLVNAASGGVELDLTAVASLQTGKRFIIKRIDSSSNSVTVDPNSSETIDDETLQTLNQYDCLEIFSDGSEWWIK